MGRRRMKGDGDEDIKRRRKMKRGDVYIEVEYSG